MAKASEVTSLVNSVSAFLLQRADCSQSKPGRLLNLETFHALEYPEPLLPLKKDTGLPQVPYRICWSRSDTSGNS